MFHGEPSRVTVVIFNAQNFANDAAARLAFDMARKQPIFKIHESVCIRVFFSNIFEGARM